MSATNDTPRRSSRAFLIGTVIAGILVVCCIAIVAGAFLVRSGAAPLAIESVAPLPTRFARVVESPPSPTAKPQQGSTPTQLPKSSPTAPPAGPVQVPRLKSPEYGVQAFLWWRPETADRDVGLAKEMGMTWVKQQFAWRDIEGAGKGKFEWEHADMAVSTAKRKGVQLLARVDNAPNWAAPGCFNSANKTMGPARNVQNWVDFLKAFVTRYKGRIRAYEIWNEPNLAREWCNQPPNPKEYMGLLKISYQTIKAIDPNAIVISAGLTPTSQNDSRAMPDTEFLEKMYAAMNNKSDGYFDLLGLHAPGYLAPPEMSPDDVAKDPTYSNHEGAGGRLYCFRHVEDMRKIMVAHGDANKQIAILEFGWTMDPIHPAYAWFKVDEQTQAKYIVGAFQYAKANWSPWIGPMIVIYLANPDWTKDNEEYWWSIDEPDGTPRAAFVRLKAMTK